MKRRKSIKYINKKDYSKKQIKKRIGIHKKRRKIIQKKNRKFIKIENNDVVLKQFKKDIKKPLQCIIRNIKINKKIYKNGKPGKKYIREMNQTKNTLLEMVGNISIPQKEKIQLKKDIMKLCKIVNSMRNEYVNCVFNYNITDNRLVETIQFFFENYRNASSFSLGKEQSGFDLYAGNLLLN